MPPSPTYEIRLYLWPWILTYWPEHKKKSSALAWTIYIQSLNLLGQSILELSIANIWETNMIFDLGLWHTDLNIRDHLLNTDYLSDHPSLKPFGQCVFELSITQGVGNQHDLWPTDLNIDEDLLLIKYYLRTKFEASLAKHSWVICCTMCLRPTWPSTLTYWPEYQ